MKSEISESMSSEPEAMQIDEPVKMSSSSPTKSSQHTSTSTSSPSASAPAMTTVKQETDARDEMSTKESYEEREGPPKKSTPRKSNTKNSMSSSSPGDRPRGSSYDNNNSSYGYPKGGRYPPPPARQYAPPPPPYGYDPHYRPPPHHHHPYGAPQMPPMHPGQPGGYAYPPPPNYHPYSSHGYAPAPMQYPPPHPMPSGYPGASDNASINSSKSKNSKLPRKKRTIDHHHHNSSRHHHNFGASEPMDDHQDQHSRRSHRRNFSSASTASTLSEGGLSLNSSALDKDNNPLTRASPKRRRGHDSNPISVNTSFDDGRRHGVSTSESAARFQKLSVNDKQLDDQTNIFLTLSTSPINADDVESTPISKNKKKKTLSLKKDDKHAIEAFMSRTRSMDSAAEIDKIIDRNAETPTPPLNADKTNVLTDEHLLNRHLRGQSFTPLSGGGNDLVSPSNNVSNSNSFSAIQPQLSWSIAGDAPSLGDLAEWEEDRQKRPASTTSIISSGSRAMAASPNSFTMWKEDDPNNQNRTQSRDDSLRLSMLSPNSELDAGEGATTPLPLFFGEGGQGEERENTIRGTFSNISEKSGGKGDYDAHRHHHHHLQQQQQSYHQRAPENVHSIFVSRSSSKRSNKSSSGRWGHAQVGRSDSGGRGMRMPPTPVYSDNFGRSPHGREPPPESSYYGHHYMGPPPPHMQDRVRNLRGRAGPHHAPMPLQVPPPISSHHTLTSPMGVPSKMWGIPHQSPHHMPPPMELNPSKRKCVPLKPPIPSKFQGDIESVKGAIVPEFTSLVNYPAHMSQKQSVNLPEGMRCCVMCGSACPCSSGGKNKKCHPSSKKEAAALEKQNGFAIIPTQNKGLCTLCDVNVWVVCQSGLEIKWCKGCKNFRPWAAFGDKGLATKCLRCRERQREKYALQKEEKEKARIVAKTKAKVIIM